MATPDAQATIELLNASLSGFDRLYGLEIVELGSERARARVPVRPEIRQPYGLVHGGVYAAIAESLASIATARALPGRRCVGMSNSTSFLRPVVEGALHAEAIRMHAGSSTWVWDVHCRDDSGRLCALTRMTIAVRPGDPGRAAEPGP
jgi:1,4-dihydroxy-2-naphthoyl-CoA hydrolase